MDGTDPDRISWLASSWRPDKEIVYAGDPMRNKIIRVLIITLTPAVFYSLFLKGTVSRDE
jgi:hypothetical protein